MSGGFERAARPVRTVAAIIGLIALPGLVGALVVGPSTPVGRNTRSATGVGHKGLFVLLESLGRDVFRFGRGVESLPEQGVFIALEPGDMLFREDGQAAEPLKQWIQSGHSALISLGPDEDRSAEIDDRDQSLGPLAKKATEIADKVADEAPAKKKNVSRAKRREPIIDFGRGGESWPNGELLAWAEVEADTGRLSEVAHSSTLTLGGSLAGQLEGHHLRITRPRHFDRDTLDAGIEILLSINGHPVAVEKRWGDGRLIMLAEARLLQNRKLLFEPGHARLAVRLVERLQRGARAEPVLFEEFSHGERSEQGLLSLAFHPRGWPLSAHAALFAAALLVCFGFRRRSPVPREQASRRSKEEYVDAVASWALRLADHSGALATLIQLTRGRLAAAWRVPTATVEDEMRRLDLNPDCMDLPDAVDAQKFVERAAQLLDAGRRARPSEEGALHHRS